jgi:hypothetical protein
MVSTPPAHSLPTGFGLRWVLPGSCELAWSCAVRSLIRWAHRRVQGSFALCASRLHTCRACSIPAASLGFYPSEVCSLPEPVAFRQSLPLFSLARVVGQPCYPGSPVCTGSSRLLPCGCSGGLVSMGRCTCACISLRKHLALAASRAAGLACTSPVRGPKRRRGPCLCVFRPRLRGLESRPRFRELEFRGWSPGSARGFGAAFNRLPELAPLLGFPPFRV